MKLHCYVALELKNTPFKPEYAGKLNFYLTALDEQVKASVDNPSIGLILCRDRDNLVAEYALRDLNKPIGISRYEFSATLPEELKTSLPTVEEIEAGMNSVTYQETQWETMILSSMLVALLGVAFAASVSNPLAWVVGLVLAPPALYFHNLRSLSMKMVNSTFLRWKNTLLGCYGRN